MSSRGVFFEAEAKDGGFCLMQEWVSGNSDDKTLTFDLTAGAGLGNPLLRLVVEKGGKRITEVVDIRHGLQLWVERIERELDEQ